MPKITISGIPAANGEYPFDLEQAFTGAELHEIKRIAGLRVNELSEAMEAGDYDLIIAFAKIALSRAGRDVPTDLLLGLNVGSIVFEPTAEELAEAEDDGLPPTSAPLGASETSSPLSSSGSSSRNGSETSPVSDPRHTGIPSLVESSDSAPETLAS